MDPKSETSPKAQDFLDLLAQLQPVAPTAFVGTAWLESLADLSGELATFVAGRLKEDVQTQHEFFQCKSLPELQHVQAKFVQTAIDQYYAETAKLVEIADKISTDA